MNASTNATESLTPTHQFSDYVKIAYLSVLLALGIPFNAWVLKRQLSGLGKSREDARSGFLYLKINLNVADTLILCVAVGELAWVITYEWRGTNGLCKFLKFAQVFALYGQSNAVVAIALDRLRTVLNPTRTLRLRANPSLKPVIAVAWILAALWSLPLPFIFLKFNIYQEAGPNVQPWWQCTDVWQAETRVFINKYTTGQIQASEEELVEAMREKPAQMASNIANIVLVFWVPFLIILTAYALIFARLCHYSFQPATSVPKTPSQVPITPRPPCETEDEDRDVQDDSNLHSAMPLASVAEEEEMVEVSRAVESPQGPPQLLVTQEAASTQRRSTLLFAQHSPLLRASVPPNGAGPRRFSTPVSLLKLLPSVPRLSLLSGAGRRRSSAVPMWRRQLRSKMFQTTGLVVLLHVLFWLPLNVASIVRVVDTSAAQGLDKYNFLEALVYVNALINPVLYGFRT